MCVSVWAGMWTNNGSIGFGAWTESIPSDDWSSCPVAHSQYPLAERHKPSYRKANEDKLKSLDASIEDARENYGDTEVFERMCEKAQYYVQIGDRTLALETYDSIPTKLSSSGQKVDIAMHKALMGFMFGDAKLVQQQIELAKDLNEKGGDWDRRNRLRVYEGMHCIMVRDFDRAAERLMDGIATYTCYEMFGYERFAFYTVLMAMHSLSRIALKKQVIDSPDILAVLRDIPHLEDFLTGFYNGRYTTFFEALGALSPLSELLWNPGRLVCMFTCFFFLLWSGSRSAPVRASGPLPVPPRWLLGARTARAGVRAVPGLLQECDHGRHGPAVWCVGAVLGPRTVSLHCGAAPQRQD